MKLVLQIKQTLIDIYYKNGKDNAITIAQTQITREINKR